LGAADVEIFESVQSRFGLSLTSNHPAQPSRMRDGSPLDEKADPVMRESWPATEAEAAAKTN